MQSQELTIPQNIPAEQAVLGILMIHPHKLDDARHLSTSSFYEPRHRTIWESYLRLDAAGIPLDVLPVCQDLKDRERLDTVGGRQYITDLMLSIATGSNFDYYVSELIECAKERELLKLSVDIQRSIDEHVPVLKLLNEVTSRVDTLNTEAVLECNPIKLAMLAGEMFEELEFRSENKGKIPGIPSGYTTLDDITNGFQDGHSIVLGGRSGMGKTTFAVNLAKRAAQLYECGVAVFSLEMSRLQIYEKFVANVSQIDGKALSRGFIAGKEWSAISNAMTQMEEWPVQIIDRGIYTVNDIRLVYKKMKKQGPVDLIIIDHMSLLRTGERIDNPYIAMTRIAIDLKELARELNIPILTLCQLTRVAATGKIRPPTLTDLRDSGAIEENADLVMLMHCDEYYNPVETTKRGEADIIVAKNRFGATGSVSLLFRKETSTFSSKDFSAPMGYLRREPKPAPKEMTYTMDFKPDSNGHKEPEQTIPKVWSEEACDKRMEKLMRQSKDEQDKFWAYLDNMAAEQKDEEHKGWAEECQLQMRLAQSRQNKRHVDALAALGICDNSAESAPSEE